MTAWPLDIGRSWTAAQAVVFYICTFILVVLTGGAIAMLTISMASGDFASQESRDLGFLVSTIFSCCVAMLLTGFILHRKNLLRRPEYLVLIAVAGAAGYVGGALLGMIAPAILVTRPAR